jgi:hypothetical protein
MSNFYCRIVATILTSIMAAQSALAIDLPAISAKEAGYDGVKLNAIT